MPHPGDLPDPEIKLESPVSPHCQECSFTTGKYKINLEHLAVPRSKEMLRKTERKRHVKGTEKPT